MSLLTFILLEPNLRCLLHHLTVAMQAGRQAGSRASRQAGRQADRQAGRQAGTQAGRQAGAGSREMRHNGKDHREM